MYLQRAIGNQAVQRLLQTDAERPDDAPESEAPSLVHEVLRSAGEPLESGARAFMEPRFNHDFSQVRVHRDSRAADSAQKLGARAYTVGQDIVFGSGQYAPQTTEGKSLLAHELTHTLQQSKGGPRPALIQRAVQITAPYQVVQDFDPATQTRNSNPALGRTDPILNTQSQVPGLHRDRFLAALNKPTLARRNFDDIPKPDLSDPDLDPVRARTVFVSYGQWNSKRVKLVQEALVAWGRGLDEPVQMLPVFGVDGNFKDETLSAVKLFQRKSSLSPDGVVGDKTLGALQETMKGLRGSIFSLDAVGTNNFQGLIHTPPPASSWTSLRTTRDFVIDHVATDPLHKALLANHFAKCPPGDQVDIFFVDKGNSPAAILAHEKQHEKDQLKTMNAQLVPWDSALEGIKASGARFRAANPQEATNQLFAAAKLRTPCDLSTDIVQEWIVDNASFHSSKAGALVTQTLESQTCTTLNFSLSLPTSTRQVTPPKRPACGSPGQSLAVSRDIPV